MKMVHFVDTSLPLMHIKPPSPAAFNSSITSSDNSEWSLMPQTTTNDLKTEISSTNDGDESIV